MILKLYSYLIIFMSKIYSTDSFFRDLSPHINSFANKIEIFYSYISHKIKNIVDSDVEQSIIEIIIRIPIFIFILFLGFIITFALVNSSEPEKGFRLVTILSTSMEPAIHSGSVLLLSPPNTIEVGDIVSFKEKSSISNNFSGRVVAHRVISKKFNENSELYITKGDANESPDPSFVMNEDVNGKVSLIIPYLGFISYISLTNWGIVLFILIPVCVLIFSEVKRVNKRFIKS
jgi:signal peptidase I